ncbi:MAG: S1C family serine protease, partial [Planctomycetota bacterium]
MRNLLIAILFLSSAPLLAQSDPRGSIVKIYTTYQQPSYSPPWQMERQQSRTGSGCIISGGRILTNAHVVSDRTFISVRRAGKADKYVARVESVSHELDLAILKVDKEEFYEGTTPLELGELPDVGDSVVVYGFPKGGTRLTITEGVVSRIDRRTYTHSYYTNLVCQIDAAINSGASGGPVISDGKIVGVAFQVTSGESIGYMVPAPVVQHYFKDLEDGTHSGVPELYIFWQKMESPQLRAYLGMTSEQSGILVTQAAPRFLSKKRFQLRDIILSVDGHDVANDGTIEFRPEERISMFHAVDRKQVGETITLEILRKGKVQTLSFPLDVAKTKYGHVVPRMRYETRPTYYVVGGLVFTPLTTDYLLEWNDWNDVPSRLRRYYYQMTTPRTARRSQVIVLSEILPDQLNVGYTYYEDYVIAKVNGASIHSMRDLITAFERNQGEYHRIVL